MKVLNHLLMIALSIIVLWSLVGVSVKQVEEGSHYSLFIKTEPTIKIFYF